MAEEPRGDGGGDERVNGGCNINLQFVKDKEINVYEKQSDNGRLKCVMD